MAKKTANITILRAYDIGPEDKGYRVLVDRLWPRGLSKESLGLDEWRKELAPSTELRKKFHHRPELWEEFRVSYLKELEDKADERDRLLGIAEKQPLLLLYGARNEVENNAVVLQEFLLKKTTHSKSASKPSTKKPTAQAAK